MPLKSQLHVNQLLSNVSVQYRNEEYIWDKIWPQIPTSKDSDLYRVYDRNFKIPETKRAPKAVARDFSFQFSTASFLLEQHALKDYVGVDEEMNNDVGSIKVDTTESLTDAIYRRLEFMAASLFTKTSWSQTVSLASGSEWSANTTGTDPVRIVDTGGATILANSAKKPNFMILPYTGKLSVKNHQSVLDRVKYTSSEVSDSMLQGLFDKQKMLVPTSIYDTAAEGLTPSMTYFWSHCFLGWAPPSGSVKSPSCGYTFMSNQPRVRSWFENERNADAVEVEVKASFKIVSSLTGYLICGI